MPESSSFPLVTVAIPLRNDARLLPGLLQRLRAQTWPKVRMQIIVADGGSSDGAWDIARAAMSDFPDFTLLSNSRGNAAAGLNLALARARGAYFIRLDARSRPADDYIARCVAHLAEGRWAGVAGAQIAVGENDTGRAIALALNHPLGAGTARYRRARTLCESETIYLGAYPTPRLRQVGGWDEGFDANEDYELNTRLRQAGGRLAVAPDVRVLYIARDDLRALAGQYARYGAWRVVTGRKHPRALRPRHLAPAVWSAGLALALLAAPITPWPFLALAGAYSAGVSLVAASLARKAGWLLFPRIWLAFPTIHLSWGWGFWRRLGMIQNRGSGA